MHAIRHGFGATQQELADYLQIKVGQLAMIETEKRPVPRALRPKYEALDEWISAAEKIQGALPPSSLDSPKLILSRLSSDLHKKQALHSKYTHQLRDMKYKHAQAGKYLPVLEAMKTIPSGMATMPYSFWINHMIKTQKDTMMRCSGREQVKLSIRLGSLAGQIEVIQAEIKRLEKEAAAGAK